MNIWYFKIPNEQKKVLIESYLTKLEKAIVLHPV